MSIFTSSDLMERIKDNLVYVPERIRLNTATGHTDLNKNAENFYCGLLNAAFGWRLKNLNSLKMDFPAIDLGDAENHICVQVTSTEGREKVRSTLQKFFAHKLHTDGGYKRLIVLILGNKPAYRDPFDVEDGFDFDPDRDIWDTAKLILEIEGQPLERLRAVDAYLAENLNIPQAARPKLHLSFGAKDKNAFVGRETELRKLAEKLADDTNDPIFITGLGGMGKTELAARFCADYAEGNAFFVRFRENFTQTVAVGVASGMEGYKDRKPDLERDYAEAMALLRQCGKGKILVIDNADEPEGNFGKLKTDPAWQELRQLPLRMILTTRCEVTGAIRVGKMENGKLYRFFEKQELSLDKARMDDLIRAVDGHTMTVELIAKTLKRSRTLTVDKLLSALGEGSLKTQKFRSVDLERNGEVTQEVIYDHLRSLFNVAEISEEARSVLRDMVLLPEGGMDIGILEAIMSEDGLELLEQLIDHGWLTFDGDTQFVTIHPVVRLVCREELKPDDENCRSFLGAVSDMYDENRYDAEKFRQFAELFSQAADILPDQNGIWAYRAGNLWKTLGQAVNAIHYGKQSTEHLEKSMPDSELLALVYTLLGYSYGLLGNGQDGQKYLRKALDYYLKNLAIRENEPQEDDVDLASFYARTAGACRDLGNHEMSQKYYLKALALLEQVDQVDQIILAETYDSVGDTYGAQGNRERELEYKLKALAILEHALPVDHPEIAKAYDRVCNSYGALGDHVRELAYGMKALKIREKVLSPDHLDLAKSYERVGDVHGKLKDYEQELKYQLKGLKIREKILPPKHPELAYAYGNLGFTYYRRDDLPAAVESMKKAQSIAEQSLLEGNAFADMYRSSVETFEAIMTLKNEIADMDTE